MHEGHIGVHGRTARTGRDAAGGQRQPQRRDARGQPRPEGRPPETDRPFHGRSFVYVCELAYRHQVTGRRLESRRDPGNPTGGVFPRDASQVSNVRMFVSDHTGHRHTMPAALVSSQLSLDAVGALPGRRQIVTPGAPFNIRNRRGPAEARWWSSDGGEDRPLHHTSDRGGRESLIHTGAMCSIGVYANEPRD